MPHLLSNLYSLNSSMKDSKISSEAAVSRPGRRRGGGRARGTEYTPRNSYSGIRQQEGEKNSNEKTGYRRGNDRARGTGSRTGRGFGIGHRGRGYRGRNSPPSWRTSAPGSSQKEEAFEKQPKEDLLEAITLFRAQSAPQGENERLMIEDCEYVASYSWLSNSAPTILIPGK
jgi:hypothetical protein